MARVGLLISLVFASMIGLAASQCFITCSPGWGNNPRRVVTTTQVTQSNTRPPSAAGCGVNLYLNSGEATTTSFNMPQQNARHLEYPWMVFIVYEYGSYLTLRSGVLINNQWVLTVANDPIINIARLTGITAYFAHYRVLGNVTDNPGQFYMRVPITNYFADPRDTLALLKLPTPLGFSNWNIQSICIPATTSTCSSQCVPAARAVQSGWSIFFPDLTNELQKASTEIPTARFLNTSFQLGAPVATLQFGRYTLCGFTGFDNTYISLCDAIEWVLARQRMAPTAPPPSRPLGMPKCGINGYQASSAQVPLSMSSQFGQPRATNVIQDTMYNEFPWQVALHVYCREHPDGSICGTCSGVVLNTGWILTSRTCMSGTTGYDITHRLLTDMLPDVTSVLIRFGAQNMPRLNGFNRTQPVWARNEYNMTVGANELFYDPTRNFVMLKLPNNINFGNWSVQPICVPLESDCARTCQAGTDTVLSGWSYEGGPLRKVTFQIPTQSGTLDPRWVSTFSYGSPVAVQTYTPGQVVPESQSVAGQRNFPGQWSQVTLCGLVDGHTGRYTSTCGSFCWMANPEAPEVPQFC